MFGLARSAAALLVLLTALTGVAYPLMITAVAQAVFPDQAHGSVLRTGEGRVRGSALIGQPFADPRYFWGRPSSTAPYPYNGGASTGSNLGPLHPQLHARVQQQIASLRAADPGAAPAPVDLLTSSASGLDPHISIAAANFQVRRVARARGLPLDAVQHLVALNTEGRFFGVLGEPRVHVLRLNLALDRHSEALR